MIRTIEELATVSRGASPRPIDYYLSESGLPWLKISDIYLGMHTVFETKQFIKESGLSRTKYLGKGTFVLTNSATPGIPFFLGNPMCLHDGFLYLENISNDINQDYLFYWFLANREEIVHSGAGSIFTNLKADIVKRILIDLPDRPVQDHIVKIMNSVDNNIGCLNKLIIKKRRIFQGLLNSLFRNSDKTIPIGSLCEIKRGSTLTKKQCIDGDIPVVAGGKKPAYYHNKANRTAPVITVSASGANAGFVNYYSTSIFASDCSTIESSDAYDIRFIYYCLLYNQTQLYKTQTGGAQPHVHPKHIKNIAIPFLDLPEQKHYSRLLDSFVFEIESCERKKDKLKNIREGLLKGLLTGKISLPANFEEE